VVKLLNLKKGKRKYILTYRRRNRRQKEKNNLIDVIIEENMYSV
jgi:hypothetical protein